MATTNEAVDRYAAKAKLWPDEIAALRPILRSTGLQEELKWGKPCYSDGGKNIAIVQEFKGFLSLMFFKGALLADPAGVLESQGANTRSALRIRFTSVDDVKRLADVVADYLDEAVAVERAGLDVGPAPEPQWVDELTERLASDEAFREAFEALTPGRQREYNLHFADAKQATTRLARIDKHASRILAGKGLRDR